MLRIKNYFIDAFLHESNGIGDDVQIRFLADAQIIADVQIPGFADQRHHRCIGGQKDFEIDVL